MLKEITLYKMDFSLLNYCKSKILCNLVKMQISIKMNQSAERWKKVLNWVRYSALFSFIWMEDNFIDTSANFTYCLQWEEKTIKIVLCTSETRFKNQFNAQELARLFSHGYHYCCLISICLTIFVSPAHLSRGYI